MTPPDTCTAPSTLGVSRAAFLARIRAALDRPTTDASDLAPGPSPEVAAELIRLTQASADLPALFAAKATAAGMTVHRCSDAEVAPIVAALLRQISASAVLLDGLEHTPSTAAIAGPLRTSIASMRPPPTLLDPARGLHAQFESHAGVTSVFAAIAETGTLVLSSDALASRGSFLVPPTHIALVNESQLIPDMLDLWPMLAGRTPPTALTLVSGPSKTADIEGILVTGVHGPRAVHIVLHSPERERRGTAVAPAQTERF